ncbi:EthD family reductase [Pedobacter antarcticus]|uniref:EthD family reductase n=1 Tax=Pedobacter antarcticus TaxID=34086 RepID=UPI00292EC636|nr:EthD family reductase [Pedobacter antarcticus]
MIKVTIFYPVQTGQWFDKIYYLEKHLPLSKAVFGEALRGVLIEELIEADLSEGNVSYQIIGHLFFDSTDDFYNKYLPAKELLFEDGLKYTNCIPFLQLSKVLYGDYPV